MPKLNPTILIVEDEPDQIEPIRSYFTRRGFSILSTGDSQEAFSIINDNKPDIVLLDLTLDSPFSGKSFLEKLRKSDKQTKVIILTGNYLIEDKEIESIRSLGISEFLYKPINLEKLENLIKDTLGIKNIILHRAKKAEPQSKDSSLNSLLHDLSNFLGVIRNKCENFTLNLKDDIYKDKSDKELLNMAVEVMDTAIKAVDQTTEIIKKISPIVKQNK